MKHHCLGQQLPVFAEQILRQLITDKDNPPPLIDIEVVDESPTRRWEIMLRMDP